MAKTTTETLTEEAKSLASAVAGKVGTWVDEMLEQAAAHAPDADAVRSSAERTLGDVTSFLEDLPARVGSILPTPAPKKKAPTTKAVVGGVAIGAAAVYFLDPNEGKRRRSRVVDMVKGWFGKAGKETTSSSSSSTRGAVNEDSHS